MDRRIADNRDARPFGARACGWDERALLRDPLHRAILLADRAAGRGDMAALQAPKGARTIPFLAKETASNV